MEGTVWYAGDDGRMEIVQADPRHSSRGTVHWSPRGMSPLHRHGRDTETDKQQAMSFLSGIPSALHSQRLDGRRMHRVWKAEKGFTRLRSGWAVPDSRACLLVPPGGVCFSLLYLPYSFYIDRIASPHGCMEGNRLNIALASSHNSVTCRENFVRVPTAAASILLGQPSPSRSASMALRRWARRTLLHFEPSLPLVPWHAFSSNRPPSLPPTWRRTCSAGMGSTR